MNEHDEIPPTQRSVAPLSPLPTDSAERKRVPLSSGLIEYFPAALALVATTSVEGNDKHNPGQPLQHSRGKSTDHDDCVLRHLVDYQALRAAARRGEVGDLRTEMRTELGNLGWRVLAFIQQELEDMGAAPLAPRAVLPIK